MKPVAVALADDRDASWPPVNGEPTPSLAQCVTTTVRRYLDDLGDHAPSNLHQLLLEQIEKPLLAVVLERARGNRCRAAEILGINRNTLRKKLQQYGL